MQQQIIEQKKLIKDAVNKAFEGFHVKKDFSSEHYRIIDRNMVPAGGLSEAQPSEVKRSAKQKSA